MEFDIEEAKRICEAATPGPWKKFTTQVRATYDQVIAIAKMEGDMGFKEAHANTEFIAYSRTALPAALSEIERLTDALASHQCALKLRTKERDQAVEFSEVSVWYGDLRVSNDRIASPSEYPELYKHMESIPAHLKEVKDAG